MTQITGHASSQQDTVHDEQLAQVVPTGVWENALAVFCRSFVRLVGTDTAETSSTTEAITATGHSAIRGDVIYFTSGALSGKEYSVASTLPNYIYPGEVFPVVPGNGDAFTIYRFRSPLVGASGNLQVDVVSGGGGGSPDVNLHDADGNDVGSAPIDSSGERGVNVCFPGIGWNDWSGGTVEAGSTATVINMTGAAAAGIYAGNLLLFFNTATTNAHEWRIVESVAANSITLSSPFGQTPTTGDNFETYRPVFHVVNQNAASDHDNPIPYVSQYTGHQWKVDLAAASVGNVPVTVNNASIPAQLQDGIGSPISSTPTDSSGARGLNVAMPGCGYVEWDLGNVEAGSTDSVINWTAHDARPGDILQFKNGTSYPGQWSVISSVTTNSVTLASPLSSVATTGDEFFTYQPRFQLFDPNGGFESHENPIPYVSQFAGATWDVSVSSSALPTGAATESTLSTLNGKVTAVNTGAVTISAALPAGTNAIGKLAANAGVNIGEVSVSGTVTVGSHAVTNAGTFAAQATEADGANATLGAKADAKSTATDTTAVSAMSVLKQISASVQAPPSQAVTNAGTFAVQAASAGDTANAATDAGNPVKIGGVGHTANPTAVTDGQRVNATFDKLGKQVVVGAIRDLKGMTQTQISASTSETTIVAAVASTFCDLYGLILANTGATTTKVSIRDDTAGTVRAIIEVPTLETRGFMLPVDSALPQTAVNKNWTATCASSTTAMEVTALWVKNI